MAINLTSKNIGQFKSWLQSRGATIYPNKGNFEVLRFKFNTKPGNYVHSIYDNTHKPVYTIPSMTRKFVNQWEESLVKQRKADKKKKAKMKVTVRNPKAENTKMVGCLNPGELFIDNYHRIEDILSGKKTSNFSVYQVLPDSAHVNVQHNKVLAVSLTNGGLKSYTSTKEVHHVTAELVILGVLD